MTERVDFYVLKSAAPRARLTFVCRLAEKAYLRDLRVLILSESSAEAQAIDDLLWTFNERSFVPHRICESGHAVDQATPVNLILDLESAASADLLVNLSDRQPHHLDRFVRIAEIIDADPERRRLGRERFKSYREQQLTLETHQLDEGGDL